MKSFQFNACTGLVLLVFFFKLIFYVSKSEQVSLLIFYFLFLQQADPFFF